MNTSRLAAVCFGTASLLVTLSPSVFAMSSFQDVPDDAWFASYVEQAADLGIVSGYTDAVGNPTGYFGPGDKVTVVQSLKMEIGSTGIDPSQYHIAPLNGRSLPFTEKWWYPYFLIAKGQHAYISGCPFLGEGGDAGPDRPIKRWEMAHLLSDVYKLIPPHTFDTDMWGDRVVTNVHSSTLPNPYTDVDVTVQMDLYSTVPVPQKISDTDAFNFASDPDSRTAILQLTADGVLQGDTDANGTRRFRPLDTLNRAEAVKILLKAKEIYPATQAAMPESFDLPNQPPLPCT